MCSVINALQFTVLQRLKMVTQCRISQNKSKGKSRVSALAVLGSELIFTIVPEEEQFAS